MNSKISNLYFLAPKVTSKLALINWNEMSAKNIYDLHRALLGLYPLTTIFQDATIKLCDIKKIEESIPTKLKEEMPGKSAIYVFYFVLIRNKNIKTLKHEIFYV